MADKTDTTRRAILQASLGAGLGLAGLSALWVAGGLKPKKEVTPESEPPKAGDHFVVAQGPDKGKQITVDMLPLGGPFVLAWPKDPKTGVVKSAERNNLAMLIRFNPDEYDGKTRQYTDQGVAAFSAICTHLGCTVSQWIADKKVFLCPCHKGEYDPRQGAKVVGGPPPRPLPMLPVKVENGEVVAAGGFLSPVGPMAGFFAPRSEV